MNQFQNYHQPLDIILEPSQCPYIMSSNMHANVFLILKSDGLLRSKLDARSLFQLLESLI